MIKNPFAFGSRYGIDPHRKKDIKKCKELLDQSTAKSFDEIELRMIIYSIKRGDLNLEEINKDDR